MASSMPWVPAASVRAQMTKLSSRRSATAAEIRRTINSVLTTSLPSRCPHRFGFTCSSKWQPARPASSNAAMVRAADMGSPKPVSASTSTGRSVARAMWPERWATSVRVVSPMSGKPRSLAKTAPDTYTPPKPPTSWIRRAVSGLNAPGRVVMVALSSEQRKSARFSVAGMAEPNSPDI